MNPSSSSAVRFADTVIVAAGSSTRMAGTDKLLATLNGRPLLQWSVEALRRAESVRAMCLVARADRVDEFKRFRWLDGVRVVAGGTERSDSVRAGVHASDADVVLVHDGARPLVSSDLADVVARAARDHGAAIPVVPLSDSLKRLDRDGLTSVDRAGLFRSQTPQGARRELLLEAFARAPSATFTDEAALFEAAGISVKTVPGEPMNMKVTDAADLNLARALTRALAEERTGFGEDVHPFGREAGLMLGGVSIPEAPRLHGHSDGDVVLHALATAILSAANLGDIGRLFPASDSSTAGIDSSTVLASATSDVEKAGWSVARAHVSVVGARPHIGGQRLDEMADIARRLLRIEGRDGASVTASTGNLTGDEGAGRAIRATAFVTIVRS
jgi:2-C-methyl-D-erythritol 4-phosphate cytidylyltransferase/2-C-methyl-D-erythritol 2,4-cyclodiphosphate synthase